MIIKKLSISNFKTLEIQNLKLPQYGVLIGPNGAGKTNLINFLIFISHCINDGIETAISRQGGADHILNFNNEDNDDRGNVMSFSIEFTKSLQTHQELHTQEPIKINYQAEITLEQYEAKNINEEMEFSFITRRGKEAMKDSITLKREDIDALSELLDNANNNHDDWIVHRTKFNKETEKSIILSSVGNNDDNPSYSNSFISIMSSNLSNQFHPSYMMLNQVGKYLAEGLPRIRNYDFNIKSMKEYASMKSENYLKPKGDNLVMRLDKLFKNIEAKKKFMRLYKSFLEFIDEAEVKPKTNNSLEMQIKESYNEKATTTALLSDGTVSIMAIILAFYFETSDIVLLEEPEKYLHPHLIDKLATSIEDASMYKQIFITTHNPEILKHIPDRYVLFLRRKENGKTEINYPAETELYKEFLKNDIGMEDLFIQNILEDL